MRGDGVGLRLVKVERERDVGDFSLDQSADEEQYWEGIVKRPHLSQSTRDEVLKRTGARCHICGRDLKGRSFAVDHIWPLDLEGTNRTENLLPACSECNHLKWHNDPETIRRILFLGMVANGDAYQAFTTLGKDIRVERARRLSENWRRRQWNRLTKSERTQEAAQQLRRKAETLRTRFVSLEIMIVEAAKPNRDTRKRWRQALARVLADDDPGAVELSKAYRELLAEE